MKIQFISKPPKNGNPPTHLIVMLHGWGADAGNFAPLASMFNLEDCQFLFPNAPYPHFQVPGGCAWYALEKQDHQGLPESRELLTNWLLSLESATQVPINRTFLMGFSQGGAMTLDVGLKLPLAGLVCLSGYLHSSPESETHAIPPVFIAHGTGDSVVPLTYAQQTRDSLIALGANVEYHELEILHEVIPEELLLVESFVKKLQGLL